MIYSFYFLNCICYTLKLMFIDYLEVNNSNNIEKTLKILKLK